MTRLKTHRLLVAALAACLVLSAAPALAAGKTITDMAGRKVTVPTKVDRILCFGPGCLRLIVYLQATDKVVGIEGFEKRFPGGRPYYYAHPELGKLPTVTPGGVAAINNLPDLEGVLRAKPQVLFITYLEKAKADRLQGLLNIPVVVLSYGPFASFSKVVLNSMKLAGEVLNKQQRAQAVVDYLLAQQKDLGERGARGGAAPAAYVGGIGFKGVHGLESTDPNYLPFRWLGAKNLAAGLSKGGHLMVDKEKLLKLNPPVIFVDGGGLNLVAADYAKKPGYYETLRAFQDGKVYVLFPFNWYTTNLGTAFADAYAIGKMLKPEAFADVDLAAKADELYAFLNGKPVYAAMAKRYGSLGAKPPFMEKK